MTARLANAAAGVAVSCLVGPLDGGKVEIRTSSQPADVGASAHGTLLVSANLPDPAFAAFRDGNPGAIASANGITEVSAITSGRAGYFRTYTSGGTAWLDGQATSAAGGGEMTLDTVDIDQDVAVNITSFLVTMPES